MVTLRGAYSAPVAMPARHAHTRAHTHTLTRTHFISYVLTTYCNAKKEILGLAIVCRVATVCVCACVCVCNAVQVQSPRLGTCAHN